MIRKKSRTGVTKNFATRREAFSAFKKDYDIPHSEQPDKVVKPRTPDGEKASLDDRNVRLYIFRALSNFFGLFVRSETHLREDKKALYAERKGSQGRHFNAGFSGAKLRDHYNFDSSEDD
ncbi:MAG: hypothetical protein ACRBG0_27365 [Lewinella sp.]|uniref:hypothetical protein n=1 Tax=Lewinella sp. TaxID=2004506 RepID=UPI003D6B479C